MAMVRTQITLDRELRNKARRKAADMGISLAEYVRRLLARDLKRPRPRGDPSAVFDLGDSGGSHVARDKDRMLGEATASEATASERRVGQRQ